MRLTELSKEARIVAVKSFIVDYNDFFREDGDPDLSFRDAYRILLKENDDHEYDSEGILTSNGGMF